MINLQGSGKYSFSAAGEICATMLLSSGHKTTMPRRSQELIKTNTAKELEKRIVYGKGIIPTPENWITHFWAIHKERVVEFLKGPEHRADSILLIGVGDGDILKDLGFQRNTIVGIDLTLHVGTLVVANKYCRAVLADGAMVPLKDASMDLVLCNMVLHHIDG